MVEMDPHKRILVIVGQLKNDILYGPGTEAFKLMELYRFKNKAIDLSALCDIDRQIIERAFPLSKELENML
jgi:hypothetical protein